MTSGQSARADLTHAAQKHIPILTGWTLALLVGAASNPAGLVPAFQAGAMWLACYLVADVSTRTAEKECCICEVDYRKEYPSYVRREQAIAEEATRLHTAKVMLAAWTLARGVSVWVTAAVPLLVLWRLGGAS